MEAEGMKLMFYAIQAIVLVFALVYTATAVRGIIAFAAAIVANKSMSMSGILIWLPAVLWGIFFLLGKSSISIRMFIMASNL